VTESGEDTAAAVRRAGQPPQPLSKDMQAVLDQIKGGECAWLAAVGTGGTWKYLTGGTWMHLRGFKNPSDVFFDNLQSVTGGLDLGDDIRVSLVVHTNSPKAADRTKNTLKHRLTPVYAPFSRLPEWAPPLDSRFVSELKHEVKFDTERSDVRVRLRLTDAQIERARKKN
jgi:hypothetical protein